MATVSVDFSQKLGPIKDMNGVGQPPLMGTDTSKFKYLKEANIPYSRLHDVGGWFGGNMWCDIPNIFRDFDADVNDPASYDFAFTDILLKGLVDAGVEPYYRLGVTIENFHQIKPYRIFPPKDYGKWAEICEHIIRHYNEGWANGFHYGIKYWEIWNEPDGAPNNGEYEPLAGINENAMWKGSKEEFFDLYRVTSKHLRKCFGNSIKIGGYGSCGFYIANSHQSVDGKAFGNADADLSNWDYRIRWFYIFFMDFIEMVKKENLPFDFFSHHSYASPKDNLKHEALCEKCLAEMGLSDVEIHLNEWNTDNRREDRGTTRAAGNTLAQMCLLQHTKLNILCYYDARIGTIVFGGLFDPDTTLPVATYYSMKAFGELRKLGTEVKATSDNEDVVVLAATDGTKKAAVIVNIGETTEVHTDLYGFRVRRIDQNHFLADVDEMAERFTLAPFEAVYLEK